MSLYGPFVQFRMLIRAVIFTIEQYRSLLDPDHEGTMILLDGVKVSPSDMASHPTRLESSATPLRESQSYYMIQ